MIRRGVFAGGVRSIPAVAMLVTRESVRNGSFALVVLTYLVYMGLYTTATGETAAAVARFVDHAVGGAGAMLLLCGVFLALGSGSASRTDGEAARVTGPAIWYWGRVVGALLVLGALSFVFTVIAVIHHGARFGDLTGEGFALERRVMSPSFGREDEPMYLRAVGDEQSLPFEYGGIDARRATGGHVVKGRFAPKLIIAAEGGSVRSRYPVKIRLRDPASDWERIEIVRLESGRGSAFQVPLPPRPLSGGLEVTVEKIDPTYSVKFTRRDLQLVAGYEPLVRCMFRGAVVLALYATVLSAVASFLMSRFSWGVSLLAACGLLVLMTSLDVVEVSILDPLPRGVRLVILEGTRTVLPDFDEYDMAGMLSRRIAVTWDLALGLGVRLTATVLLLGIIEGRIGGRRR